MSDKDKNGSPKKEFNIISSDDNWDKMDDGDWSHFNAQTKLVPRPTDEPFNSGHKPGNAGRKPDSSGKKPGAPKK